ncbi:MAG: hypothetical protein IJQ04_07895 [Prevotella sp.]|nr:hypothetical protein [Prevotella sp.]
MSRLQVFANIMLANGKKRGRELIVGTISQDVVADLHQKGIMAQRIYTEDMNGKQYRKIK